MSNISTKLVKIEKGLVFDYSSNKDEYFVRCFLYDRPGILIYDVKNDMDYRYVLSERLIGIYENAWMIPVKIIGSLDEEYVKYKYNYNDIISCVKSKIEANGFEENSREEFARIIYGQNEIK